jgi:hypothetical protein
MADVFRGSVADDGEDAVSTGLAADQESWDVA